MQNKFSNAGYQSKFAIKYGEILSVKTVKLITIIDKKLKP